LKEIVTAGNWAWCETVSGASDLLRETIAASGIGLLELLDELEDPDDEVVPPLDEDELPLEPVLLEEPPS